MVIFTSICANYLHKARTLARSVKENIKDVKFIVCLVEEEIKTDYLSEDYFDVVLAKNAWEGNFHRFIFKHNIVEAATSVKGQFFRYLHEKYPNCDQFIYLDPDVYVYSDFTELIKMLNEKPIILSPHLLQSGNIDMELSSLIHGVYNLGFLAINKSKEAEEFINWWAERLYLFCYDDKKRGIFTDQKWVTLAPCLFNAGILKHRGYNFAIWSLLDSGMEETNGDIYIHGDPLRFIHFSGFGQVAEDCMVKWLPEGDHPFKRLYEEYKEIHDKNNLDKISETPWSYGYYHTGEAIDDKVRIKYREDYDVMFSMENPFEKSNAELKFKLNKKRLFRKTFLNKFYILIKKHGLQGLVNKLIKNLF